MLPQVRRNRSYAPPLLYIIEQAQTGVRKYLRRIGEQNVFRRADIKTLAPTVVETTAVPAAIDS